MVRGYFKRNGILVVTAAVYLAAVLGIALSIDVLIYQKEKRNLFVRYIPEDIFLDVIGPLMDLVDQWQNDLQAGKDDREILGKIEAAAHEIVQGPSSIYHIAIKRADGTVLFDEETDKFAAFNDFSNSLWLRRFTNQRIRQVASSDPSGGRATVWVYFTTPRIDSQVFAAEVEKLKAGGATHEAVDALRAKNEKLLNLPKEIADLTQTYRQLTFYLVAALTVLTAIFVKGLLLPVRSVIGSIEVSTPERTRFIRRPSTQLERLYNEMARHTVLARLQERLAARINQGSPMTGWELVRYACAELVAQQAAVFAGAVELAEEGAGRLRWTSRWAIERSGGTSPSPEDEPLAKIMAEAMAGLSDRPVWLGTVNSPRAFVGRWVNDPERPGVRYGLAIALGSPARPAESASAESLLNRFAAIIYGGLEALQGRNRTLVRERDRVGINLSRNLGHDLTNIIAASKLELMTLEELLGGGDVPAAGPRREILSESLQGLLNSTKFLQEIVNLYRAYAFLKEPTLETHDPNDLIADTARLFRLSTSEKVRVIERLDPSAPRFRVDPRLFKLALFNLLANAVDAIRRGPGREGDQGTITISSAASPGNGGANSACGGVTITVEDSGPGILNESGSLASAEEIERIFQLGFTLGREGKGEGLGLNWVRTIVRDIHGGTIRASNAPEGGARFTLEFPPIEYAPTA